MQLHRKSFELILVLDGVVFLTLLILFAQGLHDVGSAECSVGYNGFGTTANVVCLLACFPPLINLMQL